MPPQFFGQEIKATVGGELNVPVAFRLDDHEYKISAILDAWPDHGFGKAPLHRKRWWHRRHRNYYRVRTDDGKIFEIYHDRGTSLEGVRKGKWFLYRQL